MGGAGPATPKRRPGRPRSAAAEHGNIGAALGLAAGIGLTGVTIKGAAARAGVGGAAIYRP